MNSANAAENPEQENDWFKVAFGPDYREIYSHRDSEEAGHVLDLVCRAIPELGCTECTENATASPGLAKLAARLPVLDLCCGAGRHLIEARRRGLPVLGLDLSPDLLNEAHQNDSEAPLVRADMRVLPFKDETFGALFNFFTSFGYFTEEADHQRAVREMARVIAPGGYVLWDHLNPPFLRANLVERSERHTASGALVRERRWIDEETRRVEKELLVWPEGISPDTPPVRTYRESVRFFEPDEAEALFAGARLTIQGRYGDYISTASFSSESPRQIVLFQKA